MSKLSASNGSFQWTQIIGGQGAQVTQQLAVASSGDPALYVSGDFDTEAKIGNVTLTGPAGSHFLAKINPTTGATIWAKSVPVAAYFGSVAATTDGVVVAGDFSGTRDFDPGAGVYSLTSVQAVDTGLLKLDSAGNFVWARRMGGSTNSNANTQALAVNADGHIFLTGEFRGTADFGSQVFTTTGNDGFFVELDGAGSFVNAYQLGDRGYAATVDGMGNVYATGAYTGSEGGALPYDLFPTGELVRGFPGAALVKFSPSAPPIDPTPSIQTFTATPQSVIAGDNVTLSIARYRDLNRQVQAFNYYLDNGDGVLNSAEDQLVGSDVSALAGWSIAASTVGLPSGTYTYFAEAVDEFGDTLASASVEVDVVAVETVTYTNSTSAAIPDTKGNKNNPTVTPLISTLSVPETFSIVDVNVTLNISHTYDGDLVATLIAPDGTRVTLFSRVGGAGDHFTNTTLDDEAATAITSGAAPFSGSFRPAQPLSVLDGKVAAGAWKLEIRDMSPQDAGTLHSWSLQFTRAAAPMALAGGPAAAAGESGGGTAFVSTTTVTSTTSRSTSGPKATAAPSSRPANNLLLAMDSPRRLTSDSVDSVMTDLSADELAATSGDSLDDELLAALAGV